MTSLTDQLFPVTFYTVCTRANCKRRYVKHDHCQGKTSQYTLCQNRPLLQQYCHLHTDQSRCFYIGCKQPAWQSHAHCWEHRNHHEIYKILVEQILYRGSKFEKRLDLQLFRQIILYL